MTSIPIASSPFPNLRNHLIFLLYFFAKKGIVHCELYRHLMWIDDHFDVIDWDDQYRMDRDTFPEFENMHILPNRSFGSRRQHWTPTQLFWKDVDDINLHLARLALPMLSDLEIQSYFHFFFQPSLLIENRLILNQIILEIESND